MPTFHFQAWNAEQQSIAGELQAETVQDAIAQLEERGLTLQSISHKAVNSDSTTGRRSATDANSARDVIEQSILRTHLAKVIKEGKAIVPALQAFGEEMPAGRRRNELHKLIQILERGDVSEAESAFAELPDYWIPLLSAAISSSDPGRILQEFIRESQRADELRRQWGLMLSYPLLITALAGAVLIFLSFLVIPIFRDIFAGFGLQLPWLTSLNLTVASWIVRGWPYMLVAFGVVSGMLTFYSLRGRRSFGESQSLFAFFGKTTSVAHICRFMADLLEAELSIPETLQVAGFLTDQKRLRQSVWRLADQLQIDAASAKHLQPPPKMATAYYALQSEMPTKSRIRLLREIGQVHTERIRFRLSWTRGLVEPLAIVVIGIIVAAVVISLFLPLIRLIDGLSH